MEKTTAKAIKKPSVLVYSLAHIVLGAFYSLSVKLSKKECEKIEDGPILLLGTHTSFHDFFYLPHAAYPKKLNVVANEMYFNIPVLGFLLRKVQAIPKKLFTHDLSTMRKILKAAEQKLSIAIFPEGRLSIDGTSFNIFSEDALIKMIRKIGYPVYIYRSKGGFLAGGKWRQGLKRLPVTLSLKKMLSVEELQNADNDEIKRKLKEFLSYRADQDLAEIEMKKPADVSGLEKVLFLCPNCKEEEMEIVEPNVLRCPKCGMEQRFDPQYKTQNGEYISDLYVKQREIFFADSTFPEVQKCDIYAMTANSKKEVVGSGVVTFYPDHLSYVGTLRGKEITMERNIENFEALLYVAEKWFEIYEHEELLFFSPEDKTKCVKWSVIWDYMAAQSRACGM